jgi:two-component system response regulator RegX3
MIRVLVVEDEESFSDALSYMLRREGFDAVVASTGPDALAEFDRGGADIVLLDLMLPGLPGTEVCRALRARSNVPIIMLTAKDGEIDKVVGLELGADDYVTKPYSARELVARIRAVLRRTGGAAGAAEAPAEPLVFGGLTVDLAGRRAVLAGEELNLARKEFDLLAELARHAGRVVTREDLMARVWDENWFGSTKTLDVHIGWLRRKLDDDPTAPRFIETVRGVGFRFLRGEETAP